MQTAGFYLILGLGCIAGGFMFQFFSMMMQHRKRYQSAQCWERAFKENLTARIQDEQEQD